MTNPLLFTFWPVTSPSCVVQITSVVGHVTRFPQDSSSHYNRRRHSTFFVLKVPNERKLASDRFSVEVDGDSFASALDWFVPGFTDDCNKVSACLSKDTTVVKFDEVRDEEFSNSAIMQWNEINYFSAGKKLAPLLCNQAQLTRPYWVPGFEVVGFAILCAQWQILLHRI